jgi:hypothetical protein
MKDFNFPNLGLGTWCVGAFMLSATFGILAGLALIPVFSWYENQRLTRYVEMRTRLGKAIREAAARNGEAS